MRTFLLAAAAMLLAGSVHAAAPERVDYATPEAWLCRPGHDETCRTAEVGALAVDPKAGARTPQAFPIADDAPIDCFYVYPTVSRDASPFSDMSPGPEEIAVVRSQLARLGTRCRLFAPIYRQLTLKALSDVMSGQGKTALDFGAPYADVRDAWRDYLARDNKGRGVILVGHSQGSILLTRLIAEEIDGKPAQKRLVSAFLSGHPGLGVPQGKDVGGAFRHVPLCRSAGQLGCVWVWSSFRPDDATTRIFGVNPAPGMVAACTNPAAPGGGRGLLKPYFRKPAAAPAEDPPYVSPLSQLSAECVDDAQGSTLRVRVEPGPYESLLNTVLERSQGAPGWGLHILDIPLTQGNLLELIDAETAAWAKASR
jgi:pimeloyl-ACP methyl ester carboxylesterase